MNKYNSPPPEYGPPPAAPPSYSQAVGGVPPSSPFTPGQSCKQKGFFVCYFLSFKWSDVRNTLQGCEGQMWPVQYYYTIVKALLKCEAKAHPAIISWKSSLLANSILLLFTWTEWGNILYMVKVL